MKTINAAMFTKMVMAAAKMLDINKEKINALNVFPVPDGDTGINMSLTMQSAVKELKNCKSNRMNDIADAVSKGALRGARGNSGVILSQVLSGICSVIRDCQTVDTKTLAKALKNATTVAYSAVSKPKEGTILTVSRMISEKAQECYRGKTIEEFFAIIIEAGQAALEMTPQLLPVLKKAGVVDSGGMGLMTVYRGMNKAILGEEIEGEVSADVETKPEKAEISDHADILNLGEIEFGYCTEFFIINLKKKTTVAAIDKLREYLMSIGDSVIVVGDLSFVKVHVHTNNPGFALTKALELGEVDKIKIENMLEENRELIRKYEAEKKPMGMLAISQGEGLSAIFKDLLVDSVVEGGQTMNPSASDIADAVCKINADNIFVFPNNTNIILAAEQAKSLVEGKKIHVIPTKNVPQGFSSALAFNPEASVDENLMNMLHAIDNVTTASVTYSIKTTKMDRMSLKEGDILGLDNKKILAKGSSVPEVTKKLVSKLVNSTHSIINLYYGNGITEEEATALADEIAEAYPDCDVQAIYGGQPIYYYIISVE